jgi:hypothetical protein
VSCGAEPGQAALHTRPTRPPSARAGQPSSQCAAPCPPSAAARPPCARTSAGSADLRGGHRPGRNAAGSRTAPARRPRCSPRLRPSGRPPTCRCLVRQASMCSPLVDVVVASPCSTTPHDFEHLFLSDALCTLLFSGFPKVRGTPTLAAQGLRLGDGWPKRRRSVVEAVRSARGRPPHRGALKPLAGEPRVFRCGRPGSPSRLDGRAGTSCSSRPRWDGCRRWRAGGRRLPPGVPGSAEPSSGEGVGTADDPRVLRELRRP